MMNGHWETNIALDLSRRIAEIQNKSDLHDLAQTYELRLIRQTIGDISKRLTHIEARLDKPTTGARLTGQVKALWDQTWMKILLVALAAGGNTQALSLLQSLLK